MTLQPQTLPGTAAPAAARAGGSSFYLAMRILDRARREAMFEIYSFCRAVDDIADGDAPHAERLARLADWRQAIETLYSGAKPAGLDKLAEAIRRYRLRQEDFLAVIAGVEMDAREDIQAPTMQRLEQYCDGVACAVGRLSVRIFGMAEADGRALAHHLGLALQLTNILRDVDEDSEINRLYLPREALAATGIAAGDPRTVIASANLAAACNYLATRARGHFVEADAIMARSPHRVVRAPKIMGKVYRQILEGMIARGWSPPRQRVRLNKSHLVWIALRHAFF